MHLGCGLVSLSIGSLGLAGAYQSMPGLTVSRTPAKRYAGDSLPVTTHQPMRILVVSTVMSLAFACGSAQSPKPPEFGPIPAPSDGKERSWWQEGDGVCPSGKYRKNAAPGAPPAAGRIVHQESPRTVFCEAGGAKHGPASEWRSDGTVATGEYYFGLREGEWTSWYADGSPASVEYWAEGRRDGRWVRYRAEGTRVESGSYENGHREGMWLRRDDTDTVHFQTYKRGKPIAEGEFVGDKAEKYKDRCVVARRAPFCKTIVFGDVNLGARFGEGYSTGGIEFGMVVNFDRSNGLGLGVGALTSTSSGGGWLVRGHYRRYLGLRWFVDLAPGWYSDGLSAKGTLWYASMVGLGLEYRLANDQPDTDSTGYVTLEVGSVVIGKVAGALAQVAGAMFCVAGAMAGGRC